MTLCEPLFFASNKDSETFVASRGIMGRIRRKRANLTSFSCQYKSARLPSFSGNLAILFCLFVILRRQFLYAMRRREYQIIKHGSFLHKALIYFIVQKNMNIVI